ncbi:hypothetical protein Tco_0638758, partial [Tanacetum coccineum]
APRHEVNETNDSQAPVTVLLIVKEDVQGGTQIMLWGATFHIVFLQRRESHELFKKH